MKLLKLSLISLLALTAISHADTRYNQVSLSSQVSQNVANDELTATLLKEAQAPTAKALAKTLTLALNNATERAKKYPAVKVSTGHQNTYPRYNNSGKIIGFTGSVSLNIQSQDFEQASELIAELQSDMTMGGLNFRVSDHTKEKTEKELMTKAIARFQEEARNISRAFGARDYKIVSVGLTLADAGYDGYATPMLASLEKDARATPQFESGDSKMTYRASGTIELVK